MKNVAHFSSLELVLALSGNGEEDIIHVAGLEVRYGGAFYKVMHLYSTLGGDVLLDLVPLSGASLASPVFGISLAALSEENRHKVHSWLARVLRDTGTIVPETPQKIPFWRRFNAG